MKYRDVSEEKRGADELPALETDSRVLIADMEIMFAGY